MRKTRHPIPIRTIAFLSWIFLLFLGCSDTSVPPQPMVITQKISIEKAAPKSRLPATPQREKADKEPTPLPSVEKGPEIGSGTKPKPVVPPPVDPSPAEAAVSTPIKETEKEPSLEIAYEYSPKGKTDPFMPWFENKSETVPVPVGVKAKLRVSLTPLEKLDLVQLRLVGIILSPRGNQALVEEPSGKGYIITEGTYIGTNGGKVAKILKDRVMVEEVVKYGLTDTSIRRKELKLRKPPGED